MRSYYPSRRFFLKAIGTTALLPVGACSRLASKKPNIIYILADDLGYGDLGCYGQKNIRTPHLDRMAAEGMRFTSHYAGSTVCAPSRCSLMTGMDTGHALIRGKNILLMVHVQSALTAIDPQLIARR